MSYSLFEAATCELIVKKSRFIACIEPIEGRAQALKRVAQLRQAHPEAAHVCWALLAGGQSAAHDDGEPSGTAGRPMLEVLRHQKLQGVLASVVRYFGGIKLGAGGLVRAYTDAVAQALLTAQKVPLIEKVQLTCTVPYALEGLVRRELELIRAQLLLVQHDALVTLTISLERPLASGLIARLNEAGMGRVAWHEPMTVDN